MKSLLAERARPSTPAQHFFNIVGLIHGSALATYIFRFAFSFTIGSQNHVAEDASHRGESLVTFARDPQQLANRDNLARALNGDDLATTCKPR
jgi:hypothetical protein